MPMVRPPFNTPQIQFPPTKPRRKQKIPPPLSARIAKAADPIYKAQGFADAHILRHWVDIVGRLSEFSLPEKLTFPRRRDKSAPNRRARPEGGTLLIRVEGPAALEFQHMGPQILDRINGYYGYQAITRLKLIQGPLPIAQKSRIRVFRTLAVEEETALAQELSNIGDTDLKASLERLGRKVLASNRPAPAKSPKSGN